MTKVFDTRDLKALNTIAALEQKSRVLSPGLMRLLDPDGYHVEFFSMIHNDIELRLGLMVKLVNTDEPVEVFLDVDPDTYDHYGFQHTDVLKGTA
jgi:hypothetical protein